MNFMEIAENRQSCRSYDAEKAVEQQKSMPYYTRHGCLHQHVTVNPIT